MHSSPGPKVSYKTAVENEQPQLSDDDQTTLYYNMSPARSPVPELIAAESETDCMEPLDAQSSYSSVINEPLRMPVTTSLAQKRLPVHSSKFIILVLFTISTICDQN